MVLISIAFAALLASPTHVSLSRTTVLDASVNVITANLNEPSVRVGIILADGFPGTDQDFERMINKAKPFAAVNGAYFDGGTKKPIGDIVVEGILVHSGRMGTALVCDPQGKPDIFRVTRHKTVKWDGFRTVLACGPALVLDGSIDVLLEQEGFTNPRVTGSASRMAIGYTKRNKLIIAMIGKAVTFEEEARIMLELGCFEAMNLDAGASLAMYYDGKVVRSPSRPLTNVLGIWVD
ncbi:MAG TPA: phosphodiester glycosidase family protein [Fimbriimonadaceae bacterium]|nr:phosphodiester glycosidase family protein [Fimbriimonadaceae bacterium]HRJ96629.1 phosphodiester glycosidase family protein [Fimbriimonadaceae bacterium]